MAGLARDMHGRTKRPLRTGLGSFFHCLCHFFCQEISSFWPFLGEAAGAWPDLTCLGLRMTSPY